MQPTNDSAWDRRGNKLSFRQDTDLLLNSLKLESTVKNGTSL